MNDVIKIKKPNQVSNVKVSHEASSFYADLSKQWAIKLDKPIENGEYSSKYYAKISEQNADSANKSAKSAEEAASNLKKCITNSLYFPELKINNEDVISNKLKLQKRSTFDKSKFTVVGSPTITDDGVASGFSSGNYIKKDNVNFNYTSSFEIFSPIIRLNSNISTREEVFYIGSDSTFSFDITFVNKNNNITLVIKNNNNSDILRSTKTLSLNTNYQFKATFKDGHYAIYAKENNGNFEQLGIITNSNIYPNNVLALYFGFLGTIKQHPFKSGSIDLSHFSITVDGKEVFSGNKTGLDVIKPDNYTVVGSPTITEDGIASGFSGTEGNPSVAIRVNYSLNSNNKVTIKSTQKALNLDTSNPQTIWSMGYGSNTRLEIFAQGVAFREGNTQRVWISAYSILGRSFIDGDIIYSTVELNGDTVTATIMCNNTVTSSYTGMTAWSTDFLSLGFRYSDLFSWHGSIDLNAFKIYVDGDLVYQPCLKIPYTQSKTGSKIVDDVYRERVQDMYEQCGYTHYYTLGDEDYTLATCKGSDVVESGDNYEQTADLTLKQWGSATSGQTVNLLPYKDTNYAVTLANGSKTKSSFVANGTGDYFAVGKTVLG